MSNLKVNAKTNLKEFKRKHNNLVDSITNIIENAIQADKEVISKIKITYYEDANCTYVTFPKGIIPLSFRDSSGPLFFKGLSIVDESGEPNEDYDVDDIYVDNDSIEISLIGNNSDMEILALDYISSDKYVLPILNSYYLYYPVTSGGTKLYSHVIKVTNIKLVEDGASNDIYITLISTSSEQINTAVKFGNLLLNLCANNQYKPIVTKMVISDYEYDARYNRLNVTCFDQANKLLGIEFDSGDISLYHLTFNEEGLTIVGSITDTVTPL